MISEKDYLMKYGSHEAQFCTFPPGFTVFRTSEMRPSSSSYFFFFRVFIIIESITNIDAATSCYNKQR